MKAADGPQIYGSMKSVPGFPVLIKDDVRRGIVFIGIPDSDDGMECIGTGFFQVYKGTN
jgi:hypothetical protein